MLDDPIERKGIASGAARDDRQDADVRTLIVSVATLTDQVAEIVVAQHKAARDLDARAEEITEIRHTVQHNAETAKEVLDLFETLKGGFKVLGWLGSLAKGLGGIAAAVAAIFGLYQAFKHGTPPK